MKYIYHPIYSNDPQSDEVTIEKLAVYEEVLGCVHVGSGRWLAPNQYNEDEEQLRTYLSFCGYTVT